MTTLTLPTLSLGLCRSRFMMPHSSTDCIIGNSNLTTSTSQRPRFALMCNPISSSATILDAYKWCLCCCTWKAGPGRCPRSLSNADEHRGFLSIPFRRVWLRGVSWNGVAAQTWATVLCKEGSHVESGLARRKWVTLSWAEPATRPCHHYYPVNWQSFRQSEWSMLTMCLLLLIILI